LQAQLLIAESLAVNVKKNKDQNANNRKWPENPCFRAQEGYQAVLSCLRAMRYLHLPYCSKVHPGEQPWEAFCEKQFLHTANSSLEEVIDRLFEGLTQLESEPKRLRSIIYLVSNNSLQPLLFSVVAMRGV
jgi:hypothetical protein